MSTATTMWLKPVSRFEEVLLVRMHLTAGAPVRGAELLFVGYTNTNSVTEGVRNQCNDIGLFSFVTRYHTG